MFLLKVDYCGTIGQIEGIVWLLPGPLEVWGVG